MQITTKYWRTARALALYHWGDAEIADHILACADGTSYEPDDKELTGTSSAGDHRATLARCADPGHRLLVRPTTLQVLTVPMPTLGDADG